jgi:hypothetical protein
MFICTHIFALAGTIQGSIALVGSNMRRDSGRRFRSKAERGVQAESRSLSASPGARLAMGRAAHMATTARAPRTDCGSASGRARPDCTLDTEACKEEETRKEKERERRERDIR